MKLDKQVAARILREEAAMAATGPVDVDFH